MAVSFCLRASASSHSCCGWSARQNRVRGDALDDALVDCERIHHGAFVADDARVHHGEHRGLQDFRRQRLRGFLVLDHLENLHVARRATTGERAAAGSCRVGRHAQAGSGERGQGEALNESHGGLLDAAFVPVVGGGRPGHRPPLARSRRDQSLPLSRASMERIVGSGSEPTYLPLTNTSFDGLVLYFLVCARAPEAVPRITARAITVLNMVWSPLVVAAPASGVRPL